MATSSGSPPAAKPEGRIKELIQEDESIRPRSDSTGSRVRAWSGTDFETPGRPRTFTLERAQRKLVVMAVDDSQASAMAFDWFIDILYTPEFFLVLLHVPELPSASLVGDLNFSPGVWDATMQESKSKIAKLKASFEKKLQERQIEGKWLTLSTGRKPGEAIVKAAHEYKAAFVVMGARGASTLRRTFMGSVSDYVTHHVKVPVLVCKKK